MERCSGKGPLDLLLLCGHEVVIQDHRQIAMTKKDKRSGYGDSQRVRLTKETENGFSQIEAKGYRARLPKNLGFGNYAVDSGVVYGGKPRICHVLTSILKRLKTLRSGNTQ